MKSARKLLALALVVSALFCAVGVFTAPVSALPTAAQISWAKRLTPGQTNHTIAYWWQSSGSQAVTTAYQSRIASAVQKIMYPTGLSNPIILWRTTTNSDSKMDFYLDGNIGANVNASTSCWRKVNGKYEAMPLSQLDTYDWVYGVIRINHTLMNGYTNVVREAVIIHEMMHVYGAKDINDSSTIMYRNTPLVTGLTADANQVLVNKYS
jgi:hypothetical protein